ncbi:MAG: thioredoxin family protein [Gammaproteobacteria bacterium]
MTGILRLPLRAAWIACVLACVALSDAAAFSRAEWERAGWLTAFEAGLTDARRSGRPVFVYFDAAWCSWCQQYKRDTLDRPAVRAALARGFVRVAVDADARPDLMRRYGGKGLPFTLVLAPDGAVRTHFVGVMPAPDLVALLGALPPAVQPATGEVLHRVTALDRRGYEAFRAAWLQHLDRLYDPARHALAAPFETGTTHKRTPVLAWLYLMDHGLWRERVAAAGRAERTRLWDALDTGFFNFVDPGRDDYLESSKLLEANAWMAAWQAQLGVHDAAARHVAQATRYFLDEVLRDRAQGGHFQAQVADNAYYALKPAERLRRTAPPLDRAKRADTHAQTAWALLRLAQFGEDAQAVDDAARTLDFVLATFWRDGRLYHAWRDGVVSVSDQPHTWFWVLAAGSAVERARPDPARRAALDAIARMAGAWLAGEMRQPPRLDNELAGLIAWSAGQPPYAERLPAGARDWALRQLRIEVETPPDELVIGLWAWEAALARR